MVGPPSRLPPAAPRAAPSRRQPDETLAPQDGHGGGRAAVAAWLPLPPWFRPQRRDPSVPRTAYEMPRAPLRPPPREDCHRPLVTGWGSILKKYLGKVLHNSLPRPRGEDTRGCAAARYVVKLSKSPSEHQGAFPAKYSAPHTMLSNCFLNDLSLSAWLNLPARPFHPEDSLHEKGLPT